MPDGYSVKKASKADLFSMDPLLLNLKNLPLYSQHYSLLLLKLRGVVARTGVLWGSPCLCRSSFAQVGGTGVPFFSEIDCGITEPLPVGLTPWHPPCPRGYVRGRQGDFG